MVVPRRRMRRAGVALTLAALAERERAEGVSSDGAESATVRPAHASGDSAGRPTGRRPEPPAHEPLDDMRRRAATTAAAASRTPGPARSVLDVPPCARVGRDVRTHRRRSGARYVRAVDDGGPAAAQPGNILQTEPKTTRESRPGVAASRWPSLAGRGQVPLDNIRACRRRAAASSWSPPVARGTSVRRNGRRRAHPPSSCSESLR